VVETLTSLDSGLQDAADLLEMAVEENDEGTLTAVIADVEQMESRVAALEFRRMFSGEMDEANAFLDIQAGSGGTEAQDWANMLLRMYLRWAERHDFKTELIDIDIDINPADLRIDVYRASGAGGQHVNRTESAVRITHGPSGVVVQCQNDRSQHKNKATAMKQLKAKLYELEIQKRNADQQVLEDNKSDIGWGSQIRSYVLDQSRIKDLRTSVETGNTQAVLDGDLDTFIEASLKSGL
jgi:protein subunit release factor B